VAKSVLIATANRDFDPTEVAVPWDRLIRAGHQVVFATGDGKEAACDPKLLSGVIFGQLGALPENVRLYQKMIASREFRSPIAYQEVRPPDFAAVLLPGGHAPGMRQYLESKELSTTVLGFLRVGKTVAAICHGGVVLARTVDPVSGQPVIRGRRMTALTKSLERSAFYLTAWKLGRYYRTYPTYVQDEVAEALGDRHLFETGPLFASYRRPFVVRDDSRASLLLTARWPGDASGWAEQIVRALA
jgi:putative intracellular protease/amidase